MAKAVEYLDHHPLSHADFKIGFEFMCGGNRWRCTDVGSRVIVAIKIADMTVVQYDGIEKKQIALSCEQASAQGWFSGPPYPVVEHLFDEDSILACWTEENDLLVEGRSGD